MSSDESIGKHFVGVIGDSEEDVSGPGFESYVVDSV
jgi:hypothetical protein